MRPTLQQYRPTIRAWGSHYLFLCMGRYVWKPLSIHTGVGSDPCDRCWTAPLEVEATAMRAPLLSAEAALTLTLAPEVSWWGDDGGDEGDAKFDGEDAFGDDGRPLEPKDHPEKWDDTQIKLNKWQQGQVGQWRVLFEWMFLWMKVFYE